MLPEENNLKLKILLVEDDLVQRVMLSTVLVRYGFDIQTAINGEAGVELALNWLPDLILMDIAMPVMDGIRATEILRSLSRTNQTPIFALTAAADRNLHHRIEMAGATEVLEKPLLLRQLSQKIQAYLASTGPVCPTAY